MEALLDSEKIDLSKQLPLPQDLIHKNSGRYSRIQQIVQQNDQHKLMLIAHIIFESQIKSLSTSFLNSIHSNSLIISALEFSSFNQLVLAYFLSCTPQLYSWDIIDLTGCPLLSESLLYSTILISNPGIIAIGMTRCLRLNSITPQGIVNILTSTSVLKELYFDVHHHTLNHDEVNQICSAVRTLDTVEMPEKIFISKKLFSIKNFPELCSNSLTKLLESADKSSLECIETPKNNGFKNCATCQFSSSQAFDTFCRVLKNCDSVERIDLSFCSLQPEDVHTVVTILCAKASLKKLNLDGNWVTNDSVKKLLELLGRGKEVIFQGIQLEPIESCLDVKRTYQSPCDIDTTENIFRFCLFPNSLVSINIQFELPFNVAASFLTNNQHLHQVTLLAFPVEKENELYCAGISMLIHAITTHDSLQLFLGLYGSFKLSKKLIYITNLDNICGYSTNMLLEYLNPESVEEMKICGSPKLLQSCDECTPEIVIKNLEKLCQIIIYSKHLRYIDLSSCKLDQDLMEMIVLALEKSCSEHLERISLSGNSLNTRSITKLLQIYTSKNVKEVCIYQTSIKMEDDRLTLLVRVLSKPSEFNKLLNILACPNKVKYFTVSLLRCEESPTLDLKVIAYFLKASPNVVEIILPFMTYDPNALEKGSLALSKALQGHKRLQKFSFESKNSIISKRMLDIKDLRICPNALPYLLAFIEPEEVEIISLLVSFKLCRSCGSKGEHALESLIKILTRCVNLSRLDLKRSTIPESMIEKLAISIHSCQKLQFLDLSNNSLTTDSIRLILELTAFNLTEFHVSDLTVTVQNRAYMLIKSFSSYDNCACINPILVSLAQMSDCHLRRLHINQVGALRDNHIEGFKFFFRENVKLMYFVYQSCFPDVFG